MFIHPGIAGFRSLAVTVFVVTLCIAGCQSIREHHYLANETLDYRDKKITSIVTKKGVVVYYDIAGARYVVDVNDTSFVRKVIGFSVESRPISTPIEDILEINCEVREYDGAGTFLTILSAGGLVLLLIILSAFSGFSIH